MKVSEDIDVQMLNEFKQGRLEMLYRRLYPALLLYAVRYAENKMVFWPRIACRMRCSMRGKDGCNLSRWSHWNLSFIFLSRMKLLAFTGRRKRVSVICHNWKTKCFFRTAWLIRRLNYYYIMLSGVYRKGNGKSLNWVVWRVENYGYCWTIECVGEYGKEDESQSVGYFTGKVAEGVIFILFCFEKLISICQLKFLCSYLSVSVLLMICFCSIDNFS